MPPKCPSLIIMYGPTGSGKQVVYNGFQIYQVETILDKSPELLGKVIDSFGTSLESITVIDNSSKDSAFLNRVIFSYTRKDSSCKFFNVEFNPCIKQ